ncbi:hypothetical protein OF83DRAFT_84861 [Amylostereum chailletii]|nr:hypothetical protein OF83DRAFT_84861 [Amylostereum chailletii]
MASIQPQESLPSLLHSDAHSLPVTHLESLKFKSGQLIESIQSLLHTIQYGGMNAMPSWPEILAKYSVLISQTHTLSAALSTVPGGVDGGHGGLERLALHPREGLTDAQLDSDLIPLLRNQQTTEVLGIENATVRRLAEHMASGAGVLEQHPVHEDILAECTSMREEHDRRADRAIRAVGLLREKYDWRARVEVEQEEPEELEWEGNRPPPESLEGSSSSSGDEEELENVLGTGEPSPEEDIAMTNA